LLLISQAGCPWPWSLVDFPSKWLTLALRFLAGADISPAAHAGSQATAPIIGLVGPITLCSRCLAGRGFTRQFDCRRRSFARWQALGSVSRSRDDYPALAEATIAGHPPGSSAGGERPKFGVLVDDQHMLVKFAGRGGTGDVVARRWCDLLILEGIALQVGTSHGIPAAHTNVIATPTMRFWKASDLIARGCAGGSQS